jgi:hypothetical protein
MPPKGPPPQDARVFIAALGEVELSRCRAVGF